jgi:hypothetical protein
VGSEIKTIFIRHYSSLERICIFTGNRCFFLNIHEKFDESTCILVYKDAML